MHGLAGTVRIVRLGEDDRLQGILGSLGCRLRLFSLVSRKYPLEAGEHG